MNKTQDDDAILLQGFVRRPTIDVTAVAKLKHADLWKAAKALGGQAALARHLGVHYTDVCEWVNMRSCPPSEPCGGRWTAEFIADLEAKLFPYTQKLWADMFPPELRANREFLESNKTIERTSTLRAEALQHYAIATRERLETPSLVDTAAANEMKDAVREAVSRIDGRLRKILELRFGLDGKGSRTLKEVSEAIGVNPERVRQLEARGLRQLQGPKGSCLVPFA
jgi:RNA polymerase sigma factor (sigma-70 family)